MTCFVNTFKQPLKPATVAFLQLLHSCFVLCALGSNEYFQLLPRQDCGMNSEAKRVYGQWK